MRFWMTRGFFINSDIINDVALNKSNPDVRVNFLEYMQTDPKGKETLFSWVTNIRITQGNVFALMKGGRARWKIENETFNTLKNLGYNFEHNYGHGKKYLSTILCLLMLLAFLIDQVQGIACSLFQGCKKTSRILSEYLGKYKGFYSVCAYSLLGVALPDDIQAGIYQHFLTRELCFVVFGRVTFVL